MQQGISGFSKKTFAFWFFGSFFDLATSGAYGVNEKEAKTLAGTQVTSASLSVQNMTV